MMPHRRTGGGNSRHEATGVRLALYQPDIPQNTGTILRLAACFGVPVDVVGPTGFDMSDRNLRRAAMDYIDHVDLTRHLSWQRFLEARRAPGSGRLVLLSSKAALRLPDFQFSDSDTLVFGRESAGVPDTVREVCDAAVAIPMKTPLRSLNVAVATAIVLGEALRQTGGYPS
jgi:tRNA (cytidine/uridine-2'-O-)-methyltransferase